MLHLASLKMYTLQAATKMGSTRTSQLAITHHTFASHALVSSNPRYPEGFNSLSEILAMVSLSDLITSQGIKHVTCYK